MLPKYRGAAPIQWAILNGDETTGVTIMYLDEGMDSGDIIVQEEVKINPDETTGELWNRLSSIGARLLKESVDKIADGTVTRRVQPDEYTLAPMLSKEMAKIEWSEKTAQEIKNLVRGLNPIMGTYSFMNGKKIKIWRVQVLTEKELLEKVEGRFEYSLDGKEGTVLVANEKVGLFIKAKDAIISVLEIQGENAKRMNVNDFLRGNKIQIGEIFE